MIYLASPYSHPDSDVHEHRYREACYTTASLLRVGHVVYSPIIHSHPLVEHGLPTDWTFWQQTDRELLRRCDEVIVLTLVGWRESIGVAAEIALARDLGKPVRYLAADTRADSPTIAHVAWEAES